MAGPFADMHEFGKLGSVRRETGKEQKVQVLYGKGLASHTGPESCVTHREVRREAVTGEHTGQPLSRERIRVQGADAVDPAEGHTTRCANASAGPTLRGPRPWHVWTLFDREPGDLLFDRSASPGGPHRGGEEP